MSGTRGPSYKYIDKSASPFGSTTSEGFPLRQGGVMLRPEEEAQIGYSADFDCRTFDLNKTEDAAAYKEVMDRIINRELRVLGKFPEPQWNQQTQSFIVFVQWCKIYGELPPNVRRSLSRLAKGGGSGT